MIVTVERLREVLNYCDLSGEWTWKITRHGRGCVAGRKAGTIKGNGYHYITIDGRAYLSSRLAFFWKLRSWPSAEVDHHNLDCIDNKWKNLRSATRGQNAANVPAHIDNKCGFKGVSKRRKKWQARVMVSGQQIHLGTFSSPGAAHAAYCKAASLYFGDFARAA